MKSKTKKIDKYIGKYFGPNKITGWSISTEKTHLEKERLILEYDADKTADYPREVVDYVITDQPIDLSELREKRVMPVVEQLLAILTESELGKDDISYALETKLSESIRLGFLIANEILWGRETAKITLKQADKIIREKHITP